MKKNKLLLIIMSLTIVMSTTNPVYAEPSVSSNDPDDIAADAETDTDTEESEQTEKQIREALYDIMRENPILVLAYGSPECCIRTAPERGAAQVCTVPVGSQLVIKDFAVSSQGDIFYLVEGSREGASFSGYLASSDVVTSDPAFNRWKQEELSKITGSEITTEGTTASYIYANFPQSYQGALIQLANAHPNWTFVPYDTRLDFNAVVGQERVGDRSLIEKNYSNDSWKSKEAGDYDAATGQYVIKSGTNWVRASQIAVAYCVNPVHYLDEQHIFAFEQLSFNASGHTIDGVRAIIRNTWMYNYGSGDRALEDGSGGAYSSVFMEIGQATGVSPYHLASRVVQEQGANGSSPLISGSYPGYEGYYNYFNVKASGTAGDVYTKGLNYAKSQVWSTRRASILGGAQFIGTSYIAKGQDNLYLQKFDVDSSDKSLYVHQYMQNILAPTSESVKVYNAYKSANSLNNSFVFRIPVYKNMPDDASTGEYPVAEDFIRRLYQIVLDREPDAQGLVHWKTNMSKGMSAADVALGFFWSNEMLSKNMSDSDYIDYAYRAILGREADGAGKTYWMNELAAGCPRNYILRGFLHSAEFGRLCESYGVMRGNIDYRLTASEKNADQTKFVVRLYRNILHREPDQAGLNDWVNRLQNGLSACELVEGFVYSREFQQANLGNADYVEVMYNTMLDRPSDAAGKADWVGRLNAGQNRREILKGFLYSKEFRELCAKYGIKLGTLK